MPKVVIADDEEFVRYFLKTMLESISFNVVAEVESGDQLPGVMDEVGPDILFLDINMPKMTGDSFLKFYSNQYPNTCIMILTAVASAENLKISDNAKTKYFLQKNMPVPEMLNKIQQNWDDFRTTRNKNV